MRILAFTLICLVTTASGAEIADDSARNLELLRGYAELGRANDHAAQAPMWAPDAFNNGRPMEATTCR